MLTESNNSKPYQMFLAKEAGINIPDTCITTSEEIALDFYAEKQNKIIYKSVSGIRSIVQKLKETDMPKLGKLFFCPTQFQGFIEGQNLRVHVINETTISTIPSEPTDYRYAAKEGGEAAEPGHIELQADKKLQCIRFSKKFGLFFSTLDFKQNEPEDIIICFEANQMPGYSYYEESASQPIAYTLACELQKIDQCIA